MTLVRSKKWFAVIGLGLAMALSVQSADKWETNRTDQPESIAELKALQDRVKQVVDKCSPATVAILIGKSAGSGVIVSDDGLVLTAAHVIRDYDAKQRPLPFTAGKEVTILLPDGTTKKGKTLGINAANDSGMVKITDKGPNDGKWPFLPITKSSALKKHQWVVSLGHPGGPKTGRPPVARLGIVENNTKDLVRTNCTLVGGDSGGPLFDLDGNVVGIHSRIGFSLGQNIHVPTDLFKTDWDKMAAGDWIDKPVKAATAALGVVFSDDENDDAYLIEVEEEGAAGKGGLKVGDTITKYNAETIKTVKHFREMLALNKPGDVVKFTVRRGAQILVKPVTLGKRGA